MPYDVPQPVTSGAIFREKVEWVNRLSHVDMALYGTIRKTGGIEDIAGIAEAGASASTTRPCSRLSRKSRPPA
jgi:allantoinase